MSASLVAPFPYFGGKRRAAEIVWRALGDPGGYVEPFAGSAAVLLGRPPVNGRRVETLNDADGWLVNAWRAIQLAPDEVAAHSLGPVTEIDYHARLAWLQERRTPELVSWLEGDPEAYDAKAAAWWLYVAACGIGDPWGPGPWRVVGDMLEDSRTAASRERGSGNPQGVNRELPHLGDAGKGIHRALPHLGDAGKALEDYFGALSTRLSRVRITSGDWGRVVKPSVLRATAGNGDIAVFLDPPYSTSGDLYAATNTGDEHKTLSAEVRDWCIRDGNGYRIVLCGFEGEHDVLLEHGWRVEQGKSGGGSGYNADGKAGRRERLWLSPECLGAQQSFDFGALA